MEMALGVAVNCDNTEQIIGSFTEKLNEQTLDDLMQITQDVLSKYAKREEDDSTINNTYTDAQGSDQNVSMQMIGNDMQMQQISHHSSNSQQMSGFNEMQNRHNEKIVDDGPIDLNHTFSQNQEIDMSMNKQGRAKTQRNDGHMTQQSINRSNLEVSIDHDYLTKVDQMELQNKNYQIEIERQISLKDAEIQKSKLLQKEIEKLHDRIASLESLNQKNENLASEKQRQLEDDIQMKEQQFQILQA